MCVEVDDLLTCITIVAIIFVFLRFAEKYKEKRMIRNILLFISYAPLAFLSFIIFLGGIQMQWVGFQILTDPQGRPVAAFLDRLALPSTTVVTPVELNWLALGFWLPMLIVLLLFVPPIRRGIARLLPVQADSHVHTVGLMTGMFLITLWSYDVLTSPVSSNMMEVGSFYFQALYPSMLHLLGYLLIAFVGVGFLIRRNWRDSLRRLGLKRLTHQGFLVAVGTGLLTFVIFLLINLCLKALGWGSVDFIGNVLEEIQNRRTFFDGDIFLLSLPGLLFSIFLFPASQEILYRGLLQPRFGILLTAILFALSHYYYGFSAATLAMFILGIGAGLIRQCFSTTAAIFVYAAYNLCQGMIYLYTS